MRSSQDSLESGSSPKPVTPPPFPAIEREPAHNPNASGKGQKIAAIIISVAILCAGFGIGFGIFPNPFNVARFSLENPLMSRPSESGARAAFAEKVRRDSNGQIDVIDFRKTDGQKGEVAGVKLYTLSFRASIEFRSAGLWISRDSFDPQMLTFRFSPGAQVPGGTLASFQNSIVGGIAVRPSVRATIDGAMLGEKSENGWKFSLASCRLVQ